MIAAWHEDGINEGFEAFIYDIPNLELDPSRLALIHSDLTLNNLLLDPATNQLTVVLDYD